MTTIRGLRSRCDPERERATKRTYYLANREKFRDNNLKKYGLTFASYTALLAKQDGRCAICGTDKADNRGSRFHVDHNHRCCPGKKSCGKCIRGLLCEDCNLGLGKMKDDPRNLQNAAAYLWSRNGNQ